ncbi:PAS domain-containing hybrid sensor histidine kinase/response regulator [Rubinisphaera margarita]|uniref:PAS domain-containing hybrid sensor histidine kinase/response regulator n=1 Tax=Rubinisphaera margarita TaxID=2909586 RepID=UPI001EE8DA1C|nr:ATP-binding protein [Rubinisphaera margarita]MCG6158354.1 ATP-binding protein [Rubinisphaera margarita]
MHRFSSDPAESSSPVSCQIETERNRYFRDNLNAVAIALAILFGLTTLCQVTLFENAFPPLMKCSGILNIFIFSGAGYLLTRYTLPSRFAHIVALSMMAPVLWNLLLRHYFIPSPVSVALMCLMTMASGVMYLSRRWFFAGVGLSVCVTSIFVYFTSSSIEFENHVLLQFIAAIVSLFLNIFYAKIINRVTELRFSEQARTLELNEAIRCSRESEEKFRSLAQTIPYGIFQTDVQGVVSFSNETWNEIWESCGLEDRNLPWYQLIGEQAREDVRRQWRETVRTQREFLGTYLVGESNGIQRWIDFNLRPMTVRNQLSYVGAVKDISEKKRQHEALRAAAEELRHRKETQERIAAHLARVNTELREANRKAEQSVRLKNEFVANMTHEIRTPMTAILGFTDIVIESTDDPQTMYCLETIKRNGEHLLQMINDILDVSKFEAGKLDIEQIRCQPEEIVQDVIDVMSLRAYEKRIDLICHLDASVPDQMLSDPFRIRQILLNLVSNALKFTEAGSVRVEVSATPHGDRPDAMRFNVAVTDTGIGMTVEQQSRLFKPFTQADSSMSRRYGGTGLGLAISQRLAGKLDGKISVESEPGAGSRFNVEITVQVLRPSSRQNEVRLAPRIHETAVPEELMQRRRHTLPHAAACSEHCRKILVAEDCEDNRRLIQFVLSKENMDVFVVSTGQEAVEAVTEAENSDAPFDAIIMDMQMPVMDGYMATRVLREAGNNLPIIALTAHCQPEERDRCLDAGCSYFATKPLNRGEISRLLHRIPKRDGSENQLPPLEDALSS